MGCFSNPKTKIKKKLEIMNLLQNYMTQQERMLHVLKIAINKQ